LAPGPPKVEPATPKVSPVLAILDKMMAAPAPEKAETPLVEPPRNPHAGAASVVSPTKDPLDETAELFKVIFKGEIVP
jgi:hypothetical protein